MSIRNRALQAAGLLGLAAALAPAHAAIVIGAGGQGYTQNFDTLAATGASVPWTNDSTLAGWSLFRQPAAAPVALTTYATDNGAGNTGQFYSYGTTGSSDRAFGGLGANGNATSYFGTVASGGVAGWIAAAFTNSSGSTLNGFTVSFNGEQWRDAGNATPVAQTMVLQYGFGGSFGAVTTWNSPGGLFNWASVVNTATAGAVNGNTAGLATNRGGTIATPWTSGQTLWLRWVETNDANNDAGLAIDNFSFTAGSAPSVVPLPPALGLMVMALGGMGLFTRRRTTA